MYVCEIVDVKWWAEVVVSYPFMLWVVQPRAGVLTFVASVILSPYLYAGNIVNVGF